MSKSIFRNNFITILAHVSAWGVFFSIPILLRGQEIPEPAIRELPLEGILPFFALLICIFYLNFWVLVPVVLNRYGARCYIFSLLIVWLIFLGCAFLIKAVFMKDASPVPYIVSVFPFMLILALSLSIRLLIDKSELVQAQKERENETLKSELSFLRSQISPHFLFNVMNNVVALSRVQPEKVEPTLIQLSQLMRYMLYSSDEKKVSITNEIAYLESYIDLQKLRFGDSVTVVFNKNIENTGELVPIFLREGQIEPMLLIPFVENAFKHGVGFVDNPKIEIGLSFKNNTLIFNVLNYFDPLSMETKDSDSGIGLKNVSRRLELLYGEHQTLKISDSEGVFKIDLNIQFLS
jgi:two-component system, LytTR family, sensor kinase